MDLLGIRGALAVRDHSQGVFDVAIGLDGLRAVSQARRYDLLPDPAGEATPVGGAEGISFTALVQTVRELADRPADSRQGVK